MATSNVTAAYSTEFPYTTQSPLTTQSPSTTQSPYTTQSPHTTRSPNATQFPAPYHEAYWILSEAIFCLVTVAALYLLWGLRQYLACSCNEKRATRRLVYICLTALFSAIGRFASDQAAAFLGWRDDTACVVTVSLSTALYFVSISFVYIFLWYRQYCFYSDKHLQHLVNRALLWVSRATLVLLTVVGVALLVLLEIPTVTGWRYRATADGCRDVNDATDVEIFPLLVIVLATLSQMSLIGLLMYPLLTTKRNQARVATVRTPTAIVVDKAPATASPRSTVDPLRKMALQNAAQRACGQHGDLLVLAENKAPTKTSPLHAASSKTENGASQDIAMVERRSKKDNDRLSPLLWAKRLSSFSVTSSASNMSYQSGTLDRSGHRRAVHRRNGSVRSNASVASSMSTQSRPSRKGGKKLKKLIRKVLLLAVVCLVSDILATILQLAVILPEIVYLAIFDVNLLVNIICIILSFKNWKQMIAIPCNWSTMRANARARHAERANTSSGKTLATTVGGTTKYSRSRESGNESDVESSGRRSPAAFNRPPQFDYEQSRAGAV